MDSDRELPPHPEHGWYWTEAEERAIRTYAEQYAEARVREERERCARVCEDRAAWEDLNPAEALREVAAAIRGTK